MSRAAQSRRAGSQGGRVRELVKRIWEPIALTTARASRLRIILRMVE
jgi:hypothetical protein